MQQFKRQSLIHEHPLYVKLAQTVPTPDILKRITFNLIPLTFQIFASIICSEYRCVGITQNTAHAHHSMLSFDLA